MLNDIIIHILSSIKFDTLFYITKQDEIKCYFRVGVKNIRPKALRLIIDAGLVIKTSNGKYYLDKEKLAQAKAELDSKTINS
jgi:hypothetical protein